MTRLRKKELYQILYPIFDPYFAGHGFERVSRYTWVRRTKGPISEWVSISGDSQARPIWGFSLDYVPSLHHGNNSVMTWKDSPEQVGGDLLYDPADYEVSEWTRWRISALNTPESAAAEMESVRDLCTEILLPYLDTVHRIEDLPAAFEAKRDIAVHAFGFTVNERLAYAFTFAKLGHRDDAEHWLKYFKRGYSNLPRVTSRQLDQALEATLQGQERPPAAPSPGPPTEIKETT